MSAIVAMDATTTRVGQVILRHGIVVVTVMAVDAVNAGIAVTTFVLWVDASVGSVVAKGLGCLLEALVVR